MGESSGLGFSSLLGKFSVPVATSVATPEGNLTFYMLRMIHHNVLYCHNGRRNSIITVHTWALVQYMCCNFGPFPSVLSKNGP